ncbi:PREDICTED: uncharacterized protein LOC104825417 [Tarenaya hassleriana]|uniref:uncharacterized protein LOC104825417 n=1 Tax=Tarenaya hassleriana TaxID=28532 RepID=UPI00053C80CB|nr:PREDICTED: uncharacterized protein LOC104825417 [Tarenaya hassleriana]
MSYVMKTDAEENVEEEAIIPADGSVVGGNGKRGVEDYDDCLLLSPNFKIKVGSNNVTEIIHLSDSEHSSGLREVIVTECDTYDDESSESTRGTKKLVRDYLKEEFPGKLDSTPSAHEIIDRVKAKYGTTVTYLTALRGKHKAESEIRGDHAEHFRKLPGWLHMLQKRNLGTIVSLELDTDCKSFKYLFIALGATVRGWNYMCKVVTIDATFLTDQYKGTLVVATAQDGDYHQYPLAWGIIDREKDASRKVTEAWEERVVEVKTVAERFFKCAEAYTLHEFEEQFTDLKNRYPKVAEYMQKEDLDPEKWARTKFKRERYNLLTTNGAESINTVLKKAKRFPVLGVLDICLSKTVEWFDRRRLEARSIDDSQKLTPYVDKVLHERYEMACTYEVNVLNSITEEFEVTGEKGRKYLVKIGDRSCSCRLFDIDKIPCSHAIAALHKVGKANKIPDLCSPYYLRESWRHAYEATMYLIPDCCE